MRRLPAIAAAAGGGDVAIQADGRDAAFNATIMVRMLSSSSTDAAEHCSAIAPSQCSP